jgi:ubiquinone/menaquinone biosynthesis C-methylase UbiE
MSLTKQRDIFLGGEGDAYFRRNAPAYASQEAGRTSMPLQVLKHYVHTGTRVLEIGCANGVNLEALRRQAGCVGSGVDPSAEAVETGKRDFPSLDLHRATADALPFPDASFDLVWFGFCLYVTDRALLPRVVAEADRVLKDGGFLAIVDFDPGAAMKRRYHHADGITTYKTDYARMFLGYPQYVLVEKRSFSHAGERFESDPGERLAIQVLNKHLGGGYAVVDPS